MSEKIEGSNILNLDRDYRKNNYIFLGEPNGLYDTVHCAHPFLKDLFTRAISQNWRSDEFDFTPCLKEFAKKDDAADVMLDTIGSQWEMDSSVANALMPLLAPFITNSEAGGVTAFNTYMECLTPDHEVFIKGKGWTFINEVSKGDIVLQFDPNTNFLEFVEVQATIAKKNSSDYVWKFRTPVHFSQVVTPNHNMIVQYNSSTINASGIKKIIADDAPVGVTRYEYLLSGVKVGAKTNLTPKEKLWIAFQADGSYADSKYDGSRTGCKPLKFAFKKLRKQNDLREIIRDCGYEYSEYQTKNGYIGFIVKVPVEEFIETGKTFGWVNLDEVSAEWCKAFVGELYKWDGCDRRKPNGKCLVTYSTSSRDCLSIVQTIAHFAGYRTNITTIASGKRPDRISFQLNITDSYKINGLAMTKEKIPYIGNVYCITVPSGAFIVKHNNRISISSNCVHAESYSEITRNGYPDPEEALNKIAASAETFQRFSNVVAALHELSQAGRDYIDGKITKEQAFPILYKGMTAIYLLERINFIASFAITFGLGEAGMFLPIANCVKKICADEVGIHSIFDEYCLRHMREDMHYWQDWKDNKEFQAEIIELIDSTERDEERWTDFIFKDRTIVGLTPELVKDWVRFNVQMLKQSMDLPFEVKVKENPLPWMNNWLSLNKFQNAPQEIEKSDYAVGAMRDDLDDGEDFDV
mgnify:CR=1 FL=1|jgi:ribonucleotide reductase beta subunit family protein with ferritin-like domain